MVNVSLLPRDINCRIRLLLHYNILGFSFGFHIIFVVCKVNMP